MKPLVTTTAAVLLAGAFAIGAAAQPFEYHHHHDYTYYHHDGYSDRGWHNRSDWREGSNAGFGDWARARRVDYYRHGLYRPAPGYEWRYVDGDFVLGAVATGLIIDAVEADY